MKLFLGSALFLGIALIPLFGSADDDSGQLLIAALRQRSLVYRQVSPFELKVNFVAQMNVPMRGHLTLRWESKDRWWRKVTLGAYDQIEIRNGDRFYISRGTDFTPVRVRQLISLLDLGSPSDKWTIQEKKAHFENGVELSCVQVQSERQAETHRICIDPSTLEILGDLWRETDENLFEECYSDYADFSGTRYPRSMKLKWNGGGILSAQVVDLRPIAFDESLLTPPPGASERRQCESMKHPVPIKMPPVGYPNSDLCSGIVGDTIISMTVLADGSVHDAQVTGKATESLDQAALRKLRLWKFKPAMCGDQPVQDEIEAHVTFRLHSVWDGLFRSPKCGTKPVLEDVAVHLVFTPH